MPPAKLLQCFMSACAEGGLLDTPCTQHHGAITCTACSLLCCRARLHAPAEHEAADDRLRAERLACRAAGLHRGAGVHAYALQPWLPILAANAEHSAVTGNTTANTAFSAHLLTAGVWLRAAGEV